MIAPEVRRGGGLLFVQLVPQWLCDPRYSANLRTLYGILATYADTTTRDTARGRPWRTELAVQLGTSVKTLDRVLLEGECAGLFRVERRTAPRNARENDASVYHLHDAAFWNGEWTDTLGPGQSAADAAAAVLAQRVEAKKRAGITPKGGRPKRSQSPGGGVTGDARGSDTHDARVASPVTPYVYSPVQNPPPEKEAPAARSALDARRASTGSSGRARASGCAASDGAVAPQQGSRPGKGTAAREQGRAVRAVWTALPAPLRALLPKNPPEPFVRAVTEALEYRTVPELAARAERRWWAHGYASAFGQQAIGTAVGVAVALVRVSECPVPECEDGVLTHTGAECRACAERHLDHRAARRAGIVPVPRVEGLPPALKRWTCTRCERPGRGDPPADGRCADCTAEAAANQAEWDADVAAAVRAIAAEPTDTPSVPV
ncbi:hypothetical protein ACFXGI_34750 [Streptomyces sp. NPDC059355]|uniref:hypothetical protein n=1 Tax=Streptomyces sp. NPDC059355 TaxID=3346811 RepID=UPI00367D5E1E